MTMWYLDYFDRAYLRRWRLGLPTQQVRSHAAALLKLLQVVGGGRLLDVGCGQGRYSLAFAGYGLAVVGLDRSAVLLREAQRLAEQVGLAITWVRADMRAIPFDTAFEYATLFDAFGFFETEAEDLQAVAEIVTALRPGGVLAISVANGARMLTSFRPRDDEEQDGLWVKIERELVDGRRAMRERITLDGPEGISAFERFQRLYGRDELIGVAEKAGLAILAIYSDLLGANFDAARSEKMVLLGRKRR